MIESIDNLIQLVATGICAVVALVRAVRTKEREWTILALFSGVFFLGSLYYLLFLFFYEHTPRYTSVAEMSWYTSYLFLLFLIILIRQDWIREFDAPAEAGEGGAADASAGANAADAAAEGGAAEVTAEAGEGRAADAAGRAALRRPRPLLWCIPVFTVGMFLFFIQYGDYVENAVIVILMTGLLWISVSGILAMEGQPPERCRPKMLFTVTIVFCLTEYALWFSSCFWMGDTLANPYFWFDFLLSATVLLFLPALRRVVDRV